MQNTGNFLINKSAEKIVFTTKLTNGTVKQITVNLTGEVFPCERDKDKIREFEVVYLRK